MEVNPTPTQEPSSFHQPVFNNFDKENAKIYLEIMSETEIISQDIAILHKRICKFNRTLSILNQGEKEEIQLQKNLLHVEIEGLRQELKDYMVQLVEFRSKIGQVEFDALENKKRNLDHENTSKRLPIVSKLTPIEVIKYLPSLFPPKNLEEIFISENFMFEYQARPIAEDLFVKSVCINFLQHQRQSSQGWTLPFILGGIGLGKSRFSYETRDILMNHVQKHPKKCLEWLNKDQKVLNDFKTFLSSVIIEVFVKKTNIRDLISKNDVSLTLLASLASCLIKSDPVNEREFVDINRIKRDLKDREDLLDLNIILEAIRVKLCLSPDIPLTIFWRIDDIERLFPVTMNSSQNIDLSNTILFNYVSSWMDFVTGLAGSSNFVIPIISGTFDAILKKTIPNTICNISSIPLFCRDISVTTSNNMINKQQDGIVTLKNWKQFLAALGGITLFLHQTCLFLQQNPTCTLSEIHLDLKNISINNWFGFIENSMNQATFVLRVMLEQCDLRSFKETSAQFIGNKILNGQFFISETFTLDLPLILVEKLFDHMGVEWKWIQHFIASEIIGQVNPMSFEVFPCWFFSLKVHLNRAFGIKSQKIGDFFKGALIHDSIKNLVINLDSNLPVVITGEKISNPTSVKIIGRESITLNVLQTSVALFVGKSDPFHDALLTFPSSNILFQMSCKKSFGMQGVDYGKRREEAEKSPCRLQKTIFLYITNKEMDESALKENSIIINRSRWNAAFSSVFGFIKEY